MYWCGQGRLRSTEPIVSDWPITVQIADIHITPLIGDAGTQPVIMHVLVHI